MENGEWRMENGEWKMENGKWRMENSKLSRRDYLLVEQRIPPPLYVP